MRILLKNIGFLGFAVILSSWYVPIRIAYEKEIPFKSAIVAIIVTVWVLRGANNASKLDAEIEEARNYEKFLRNLLKRDMKQLEDFFEDKDDF